MLVAYRTNYGEAINGDCMQVLDELEDNSINLVITSPPFALEGRKKSYGNLEGEDYIEWLVEIGKKVFMKLTEDGSFVIDLGGAYNKGVPTYSLYQFRSLIKLCDTVGFHLAQPFYWHNPSALPSPIEWVNKRKLRAKNSVNTIWWLSKTEWPKSNILNVLNPYSQRMERLLQKPEEFVPKEGVERPSGHVLGKSSWTNTNGGAIPPNMLQISNSESNSKYLRFSKQIGVPSHPARFPIGLPDFFIKFLTEENDLVVDIFGGSATTGEAAEKLRRRWKTIEISKEFVASSCLRFCETTIDAERAYKKIRSSCETVELYSKQIDLLCSVD